MAHFAKVVNGIVASVIVAEQDFIDAQEGTWVQTSYNTSGGVHKNGDTPFRKNYAGIGFTYDEERDAFYSSTALRQLDIERRHVLMGLACTLSQ